MPFNFEMLWFLATVSPALVLTIQTHFAREKARESEIAWKIAEIYIFGCAAPDSGNSPEPSPSSAFRMESSEHALAA